MNADESQLLVVLNPDSGSMNRRKARETLRKALADCGMAATIVKVRRPDEMAAAVKQHIERGCRTVVAAGGDGTISAVASLLTGSGVALGVIPGGTLNHFAKDLNIPVDISEAVAVVNRGVVRDVDVAAVNGHQFLNNSSLGVYPDLVLQRETIRKRGFRKMTATLLAAVSTLVRLPVLRVRLNLNDIELDRVTPFIFVGNNPYEFEGVRLGTRSRLDTGQLCICVARERSRWGLFGVVLHMLFAGLRGLRGMDVFCTRGAWIETPARRVRVSLDGELVRLRTPLKYEIRPKALRVIVPAGEAAK